MVCAYLLIQPGSMYVDEISQASAFRQHRKSWAEIKNIYKKTIIRLTRFSFSRTFKLLRLKYILFIMQTRRVVTKIFQVLLN